MSLWQTKLRNVNSAMIYCKAAENSLQFIATLQDKAVFLHTLFGSQLPFLEKVPGSNFCETLRVKIIHSLHSRLSLHSLLGFLHPIIPDAYLSILDDTWTHVHWPTDEVAITNGQNRTTEVTDSRIIVFRKQNKMLPLMLRN